MQIRPSALYLCLVLAFFGAHATATSAQGVDASIKPGDDFFAYANGEWLKATAIPAGKERWGARDEIAERTRHQLASLLDDAHRAPRGSIGRKVADYRAAWLNEAAIERRGLAPLKPAFDNIDRVDDKLALARLLGSTMVADVDPLNWGAYRSTHIIGLSVEESIHGEKNNVAFLVQGGLGLPDREDYLSDDPAKQAIRTKYQAHIGRMLTLAGFDHAAERAESVVALEMALARTQGTREASANDRNADSVWTRADFTTRAPGMDWSAFFTAAGLGQQQEFVAWQPSALRGVASLVGSQPVDAWKNYLRFHAIDDLADVLPHAFSEEAAEFRSVVAAAPPVSRAQRAADATQQALADAIGRMYAERYFPAAQKRRVLGLVKNVTDAFTKRAEGATWMSPATKARALAKLHSLYVGIGYPDAWQDYSDLVVDPTDPAGNFLRARSRVYRRAVAKLGQPIDMHEWWMPPQQVGAILIFQQNAYDFSAALLQAPKYDAHASDAAGYGAIGAIIGHDVSHFVDILGAEYDTDGSMRHWWTRDDSVRFEALAKPLVDQFSAYQPFPDVHVNGKLSETENIADLAGLSAAFDAYRSTLGKHLSDAAYVRRHDREFFIAFAQSWRSRISDAALRKQAATNDHAPENFRVSTVRNLDAWYDAFDVRPGQRLYLEPGARVRIW